MLGSVGTGWSAYWGKKYSVQKKKQLKVKLSKKICLFINSHRKTANRFLFTIIYCNNRNHSLKRSKTMDSPTIYQSSFSSIVVLSKTLDILFTQQNYLSQRNEQATSWYVGKKWLRSTLLVPKRGLFLPNQDVVFWLLLTFFEGSDSL